MSHLPSAHHTMRSQCWEDEGDVIEYRVISDDLSPIKSFEDGMGPK